MKKILSVLLALMMVAATCTALVTTTSAANVNTTVPKTWDFEDSSLSKKSGVDLLNSLGWNVVNNASNLTATVEDGALHLQNKSGNRTHMVLCENELLKEDFSIQYDFKYAAKSDLPAAVTVGGNSYSQYNAKGDESGYFMRNPDTSYNDTWFVQPRLDATMMNGLRTGSWVDTTMAKYWNKKDANNKDVPVNDRWFTLRIEYSADYNVKVWIKEQGAASWLYSEELMPSEQAAAKNVTNFISKYLSFVLGPLVDIYVDNISVVTKSSMNWTFDDASLADQTNATLLSNVGWSILGKNEGLFASIERGALRLQSATGTGDKYLLACRDQSLKGAYTLQYDFMYADKDYSDYTRTDMARSEERRVGKECYS